MQHDVPAPARALRPDRGLHREGERDDPWWQRVYAPQVPSLDRLNAGNVFIDRSKRLWMPLLDQKGPIGR